MPLVSAVDLQAPIDDVTGLPLIRCLDCRDVRVFAATTKSGSTKERDFSSVLGGAMEMSVQLLNLHCPNFVLVCPNFIPCCCNLDAGVMF